MTKLQRGTCTLPDCGRPHYARGLCHTHYDRKRNGRVLSAPVASLPGERWHSVVGWEGLYEVSDHGRVRGVTREVPTSSGRLQRVPGKLLKLNSSYGPYLKVALRRGERSEFATVHRLVLEAFNGSRPPGEFGHHKDGDKRNNRLANLAWVTPAENNQHALASGLRSVPLGSQHGCAKLNEETVAYMRRVFVPSHPLFGAKELAERFGVSERTGRKAIMRKTWRHVP